MTRGVPDQDLPENQDESVRYSIDEMTGRKTRLDEKGEPIKDEEPETATSEEPKRKPGRPAKQTSSLDAEKADAADAGVRESAAMTSRTLGS